MDEDELYRSYPASNLEEVHIEPALPLLECRVQRDSAESDTVSFLVGERGTLLLRLTNRGALPIADVDVRIQPMFVQNSEQKQITYYSEEELQAEQQLSAAKQQQAVVAPSLPPTAASPPRLPASSASAAHSTQLPASLPFSSPSTIAAKRVFDFARSVNQSRRQSLSDIAPTSPHAAPAALRSSASDLPPSPLTWSAEVIAAALPLLPGQHVDVTVHVHAIDEWSVQYHTFSRNITKRACFAHPLPCVCLSAAGWSTRCATRRIDWIARTVWRRIKCGGMCCRLWPASTLLYCLLCTVRPQPRPLYRLYRSICCSISPIEPTWTSYCISTSPTSTAITSRIKVATPCTHLFFEHPCKLESV